MGEPMKAPQYELGREPRTLFDGLLAPHLRTLGRKWWNEATEGMKPQVFSMNGQDSILNATLAGVKRSTGLKAAVSSLMRPTGLRAAKGKQSGGKRQLAAIVPEGKGGHVTSEHRSKGREGAYFVYN